MKKSIAARNYWFNYTARKNHEYQMRMNQRSMMTKFNHILSYAAKISTNYIVWLWHTIIFYFRTMFKKGNA